MSDRFTDEDLKRFKQRIAGFDTRLHSFFNHELLRSLISRLEAAEKVCIGVQKVCEAHSLKGQAVIDLKAWREACGK